MKLTWVAMVGAAFCGFQRAEISMTCHFMAWLFPSGCEVGGTFVELESLCYGMYVAGCRVGSAAP